MTTAGFIEHLFYLSTCAVSIAKYRRAHILIVSQRCGRVSNTAGLLRPAARHLAASRKKPPPLAPGPSKKRVRLRFNSRPQSSRHSSKASTWYDAKGFRSSSLPVRFKTQTCAIFSRVAGPTPTNRPFLAPRPPHLHTHGGYNAPSVYQSRAQVRDA